MSQRRANQGTTAEEAPQHPVANYWNHGPAPTWMGPLAYYNNDLPNEDMEGRFRTGLSRIAGSPGFNIQSSRQRSTPMDDTFELNQTGLSPMWRDPTPATYIDPRVGRPAIQARPPLPFQYVTGPPSVTTPINTNPASWEPSAVDVHSRGRQPASSTARQSGLYQLPMGPPAPAEVIGTPTPVPASQAYAQQQYAPYPPYPGPLSLSGAPLPGLTAYNPVQQEPAPPAQATSPGPILVQLGASHNFLVNNRPARWIQVLDVDPNYQRARTPSPNRSPSLSIYVRAPETEVHYWAVFLRDLTVSELIKRVVQKYGFSDDERDRVKMAVRVTEQGDINFLSDEDVQGMESEVAVDVKVTSLEPQSEDWQLELRY